MSASKTGDALADISLSINDNGGVNFVILRATFEKWEKEAAEGNESSQKLIDMLFHLDKLFKVIVEGANKEGKLGA